MQGVTKRCRLSWLTNSALAYRSPNAVRGGGGVRCLNQWLQLYTWSPHNFGDLTPHLTFGLSRPESIEWFIEGQAFSRSYYLASRSAPFPSPPPFLLLQRCWGRGGGGGWRKSIIIRPQESLVFYISFNSLWSRQLRAEGATEQQLTAPLGRPYPYHVRPTAQTGKVSTCSHFPSLWLHTLQGKKTDSPSL